MTREISKDESDTIKDIVQLRKIKHLVHFTHMENLSSILEEGILDRTDLHRRGIRFRHSSRYALKNAPHAISCSITFPNYPMLSAIARNQSSKKSEWVVLVINAEVLWTKPCAFCEHNAASLEIVRSNIESRMGPDAFRKNMFPKRTYIKKFKKIVNHEKAGLASFETTDVQAEVLVLDQIEPSLFLEIAHLEDISDELRQIQAKWPSFQFEKRPYYFKNRRGE